MYNSYFNLSMSLGVELEYELRETCSVSLGKQYRKATEREDKFEGTDCFIYGIRTDFTFNFSGKNKMHKLEKAINVDGIEFLFGVRFGNGRTQFSEPVLVIGINTSEWYLRNFMDDIVDSFRKNLDLIIETAQDQYWDYLDKIEFAM